MNTPTDAQRQNLENLVGTQLPVLFGGPVGDPPAKNEVLRSP